MKKLLVLGLALATAGVTSCTRIQDTTSITPFNPASAKGGSGGSNPSTPTSGTVTTPNPPVPAVPLTTVKDVLPGGSWTVKYIRDGADKSSLFAGVTFVFTTDGVVTASDNKGIVAQGSWYSTPGGITYYGGPPSIATVAFGFSKSTPNEYYKLSQSWNLNLGSTQNDVYIDNKEPLANEHLEFIR